MPNQSKFKTKQHDNFVIKFKIQGLFYVYLRCYSYYDLQRELYFLSNGLKWSKKDLELLLKDIENHSIDMLQFNEFCQKKEELENEEEATESGSSRNIYSFVEERIGQMFRRGKE